MKKGDVIAAVLLFCFLACYAGGRGTHWEFGRYGMPRTLVDADGVHDCGGWKLNPTQLAMIERDIEEEMMLGMVALNIALLGYWACLKWQNVRLRKRQVRSDRPAVVELVPRREWACRIANRPD